ncbi:MAG: response regulator transcription factor [Saprospiraceae bacterium]|nr:response regulator transcription factor [Saprospiraceae bacterium]
MSALKIILVDDEPDALDALDAVLKSLQLPEKLEVLAKCNNTREAAAAIISHRPALVFMDVIMPDETGVEFLRKLEKIDFNVVFVTAYDKYALDAIKLSALDYIMKPVIARDVEDAVKKALALQHAKEQALQYKFLHQVFQGQRGHIMLPNKDGVHDIVRFDDLLFCQAQGYMTLFQQKDGSVNVTTRNLGEYKDILLEANFKQTHQSWFVNPAYIQSYNSTESTLKMTNGKDIPVSLTYRDSIQRWLKQDK